MNSDLQCYSAARTIAVLIHLAAGPRSAPELAELLDIAKPTVRRILALLTRGGYVERVPGDTYRKRYRLTRRSQNLGHQMATAAPSHRSDQLALVLSSRPPQHPCVSLMEQPQLSRADCELARWWLSLIRSLSHTEATARSSRRLVRSLRSDPANGIVA